MTPERAGEVIRQALTSDPAWTFEQVIEEIESGRATLFLSDKAVEIVRLLRHENGDLECYAAWGGGDFRSLRDDIRPRVERFARMNKCAFIELRTRAVAAKILKPWGYEIAETEPDGGIVLRKYLDG